MRRSMRMVLVAMAAGCALSGCAMTMTEPLPRGHAGGELPRCTAPKYTIWADGLQAGAHALVGSVLLANDGDRDSRDVGVLHLAFAATHLGSAVVASMWHQRCHRARGDFDHRQQLSRVRLETMEAAERAPPSSAAPQLGRVEALGAAQEQLDDRGHDVLEGRHADHGPAHQGAEDVEQEDVGQDLAGQPGS
jgi:hypothetical protein